MVAIKEKLRVKIVDNNSEVLPIFLRDIGENLKAGEDVALVRFDAYADFLVPNDVQADEMETIAHLSDSINNHCWILPAVYRGYIKKIFWFKPPWAHQFLDGIYTFNVGKCQQTGLLKIASTDPYFTSNCVYSSIDKLSNVQSVQVYVSTGGLAKNYSTTIEKSREPIYDDDSQDNADGETNKKQKLSSTDATQNESTTSLVNSKRFYPLDATLVNQILETRDFFVDVDLSFFSTDDAIRKRFDENEYEILRYVYTRVVHDPSDSEIMKYMGARENALEQIRCLMNDYLSESKADQPIRIDNLYLAALIGIIRYKNLDWRPIHQYGSYLTDTRPPLHVSSEGMILYLVESMARILQSIQKDPLLITISRCVNDGFCSTEQADLIQNYLEQKFQILYKIDEVVGKSVCKGSTSSFEEYDEKSSTKNDTENVHRTKLDSNDFMKNMKSALVKNDNGSMMNIDTGRSASPSKSNLSPGEIKAISPSSLSDASPQ